MSAAMADDSLDIIAKLIETCRDGQAGYLEAAELARNHALRGLFSKQAMERARFAAELEHIAIRLGDADPSRGPSFANQLHRAWIDLKHRLGGGDASVLESVELGESNAQQHYQAALQAETSARGAQHRRRTSRERFRRPGPDSYAARCVQESRLGSRSSSRPARTKQVHRPRAA